jgi:hypothetical protein
MSRAGGAWLPHPQLKTKPATRRRPVASSSSISAAPSAGVAYCASRTATEADKVSSRGRGPESPWTPSFGTPVIPAGVDKPTGAPRGSSAVGLRCWPRRPMRGGGPPSHPPNPPERQRPLRAPPAGVSDCWRVRLLTWAPSVSTGTGVLSACRGPRRLAKPLIPRARRRTRAVIRVL